MRSGGVMENCKSLGISIYNAQVHSENAIKMVYYTCVVHIMFKSIVRPQNYATFTVKGFSCRCESELLEQVSAETVPNPRT